METLVQPIWSLQNRLREGDSLFTAIDGTSLAIWREPRGVRDVDPEILLGREKAKGPHTLTPPVLFIPARAVGT